MSDVIGNAHADTIYWVDMNGMRAFSIKPRDHEKVLATYVKVPSASYVSDLEARLEKAEAEREAVIIARDMMGRKWESARNDALEEAAAVADFHLALVKENDSDKPVKVIERLLPRGYANASLNIAHSIRALKDKS